MVEFRMSKSSHGGDASDVWNRHNLVITVIGHILSLPETDVCRCFGNWSLCNGMCNAPLRFEFRCAMTPGGVCPQFIELFHAAKFHDATVQTLHDQADTWRNCTKVSCCLCPVYGAACNQLFRVSSPAHRQTCCRHELPRPTHRNCHSAAVGVLKLCRYYTFIRMQSSLDAHFTPVNGTFVIRPHLYKGGFAQLAAAFPSLSRVECGKGTSLDLMVEMFYAGLTNIREALV